MILLVQKDSSLLRTMGIRDSFQRNGEGTKSEIFFNSINYVAFNVRVTIDSAHVKGYFNLEIKRRSG